MPPEPKFIPQGKRRRSLDGYYVGWLREECWNANVHLVWPLKNTPLTREQVQAYVKRTFDLEYDHKGPIPNARCMEILAGDNDEAGAHVIFLYQPWQATPERIAILAHEVFHAADQILKQRGCHAIPGTDNEAHAYLIESITRRCLKMLMS